jgi:choline monooxygenase
MNDLGKFVGIPRSYWLADEGPLPPQAYFDQDIFEKELALVRQGPGYLGHELMVPEPGDYYALPADREARVLVRTAEGLQCLSNVCRHRQALMLEGKGRAEQIVCPLHRWTYDLNGRLLGAPQFPENPCLNLENFSLQNWQGLLFHSPRSVVSELQALPGAEQFNFLGHRLHHVHVHECRYNWKTFLEVYLEDYHVDPFHPGLGRFVDCNDLVWQFGENSSVQTVGVHRGLREPGSEIYRQWHEQVLKYRQGQAPEHGAVWLSFFPNLMVEWYPHVLVVSSLIPRGPQQTTNIVEFYYPEEIALFEPDYVAAETAAYLETCVEDDEIARRMELGRQRLLDRGVHEIGPYQHPLETGMQHFHQWYRQRMRTLDV